MESSQKDHSDASPEELQRLAHEHSQYAKRLELLAQRRFLSDEEKLEEVRLKKLKLRLKDQMTTLEHQFRRATVA